jgi:glycine cleavage system H protein
VSPPRADSVFYKRARFSTRLPADRRYTAAHYWLLEELPGVWRVGFTKFATRMLGDLVEYGFTVTTGSKVEVGQEIGTIEGFKAVTALYSVVEGEFLGVGEVVGSDITTAESDPYGRGWLYRVKGRPDPDSADVEGYIAILDATIDKLLETRHAGGDDGDEASDAESD